MEGMLGSLARWLRLLGYDAPSAGRPMPRPPLGDVLITRRRRAAGRHGVLVVASDHPEEQLVQVLCELGLRPDPALRFSRCLECNREVEPVERDQVRAMVPDHVLATAACFTRCPACGKVYWPGSHGRRAAARLTGILEAAGRKEIPT